MNTIIPVLMFSLLFAFGVIGLIYTFKNKRRLDKIISNEKLISQYRNMKISDTETLKADFWNGHLKIYENILRIENSSYFHHITLDNKRQKVKNLPMTISIEQISLDKDTLILQGIKYRLFGKSKITIRVDSNNKLEIADIYKSINNYC